MAVVVLVYFLFTAAFFYVTPRMQAGFLGRTDPSQFRPEITPTIELAGGGRIVPDQTPVMHVEFPEEPGTAFRRRHVLAHFVPESIPPVAMETASLARNRP